MLRKTRFKKAPSQKGYLSLKVIIFSLFLIGMTVIALIMPLRPTKSNIEKRTLAKFPKVSFQTLVNGKYFSDVTTWYADTFPMRESLMSDNAKFKEAYGIQTTQMIGQVSPQTKEKNKAATPKTTLTKKTNKADKIKNVDEKLDNVFISGNRAYSVYGFNQTAVDKYTDTINRFVDKVPNSKVYDIVVPTSSGIYLSDKTTKELGGSNQKKAINYIYKRLNKKINKVDAFSEIDNHSKEYLYFRTDHHWTAKGAYYAYSQYMKKAGKTPSKLSDYKHRAFKGFLGTSYAYSNQASALGDTPDTVHTYQPQGTNTMKYTDRLNQPNQTGKIIADASKYDEASKYMAFIAGDEPYEEIHNPKIKDGSSVVVIKESFGNAFVPFLVNNYENVYVVDYRYYDDQLAKLVNEKHIQDVIFLNNISAASTDTLIDNIARITEN